MVVIPGVLAGFGRSWLTRSLEMELSPAAGDATEVLELAWRGIQFVPANIMHARAAAPNHFRENVSCGVNTLEGPACSQSE